MSDMKDRGFAARLGFAVAGLTTGWQREHSFRIHVVFAAGAAIAWVFDRQDYLRAMIGTGQ